MAGVSGSRELFWLWNIERVRGWDPEARRLMFSMCQGSRMWVRCCWLVSKMMEQVLQVKVILLVVEWIEEVVEVVICMLSDPKFGG